MKTANVQLSEDSAVVVAVFAGPQDAEAYPNQAVIPVDDPRYVAYKASMPEWMRGSLP